AAVRHLRPEARDQPCAGHRQSRREPRLGIAGIGRHQAGQDEADEWQEKDQEQCHPDNPSGRRGPGASRASPPRSRSCRFVGALRYNQPRLACPEILLNVTPAPAAAGSAAAGPLSAGQLDAFRRDGYVVVPAFLSAAEVASVRAWTDEVQRWPEVPGRWMMYFEQSADGRRLLNRMEDILPFHDGFRALAGGRLGEACAPLFGEPAVLFKDKINFKQPGGGGFEAHQDVQAGWSKYAALHVTGLVTVDRSTVANGCLEMVAGFGQHSLIGREWEPLTEDDLKD